MGAASGVVGAPFAGFGLTRDKPGIAPSAYAAGLAPAYQAGTILPSGSYATMWNNVEGPSHDNAHCYLGGTVCSFNAARDPMFFMIHAMPTGSGRSGSAKTLIAGRLRWPTTPTRAAPPSSRTSSRGKDREPSARG